MGFFGGLDIALSALSAQQRALEITGQNVANANTEGYSRRRVAVVPTTPNMIATVDQNVAVGRGAGSQVERLRDAIVDLQYRQQQTALGEWETNSGSLSRIEDLFGEPGDNGLNNQLTVFFNAWDEVNNDPSNTAARANLRERAVTMADGFNWVDKQLDTVRTDMDQQVELEVQQINDLSGEIARLNGQISAAAASGGDTGDLADQRDRMLDQLSKIVDIRYSEDSYGSVNVSIGGRSIVSGANTSLLTATRNPSNLNFVDVQWVQDSSQADITGGSLKAHLDLRDVTIPARISDLDAVVNALITNVNSVHSAGFGLNGDTGLDFFNGSGAGDIAVNPAIVSDLASIAAASTSGNTGDGSNAKSIAALRDSLLMNSGTATISDSYLSMIVQLGADSQRSKNQVDNFNLIGQHLSDKRQEVSGVSLDEEAIAMVRYQRAYEAAARIVTTLDETMDKVINGMGIVGRG